MKLKNFLAMMAIALCVVACSDDDKEEEVITPAQQVAGSYEGSLVMSVGSTAYDPSDATFKFSAETNGTLTLVLPGSGSGAMAMPEITLKDVKVATTDNITYTIGETEINEDKYVGKLSGTIKDNKATITYSITPGAMPFPINFEFIGSK